MSKKKKIIAGIVVVVLAVIIGAVWYVNAKYSKIKKTDLDKKKITVNEELQTEEEGYTNVAFFGVDADSKDSSDVQSDAVVVASMNNDTKEVKLLSVYGNAYLTSDDGKKIAVKEIYKDGAENAVEILNRNLDLDIEHFITVDFKALIDVIDAVGGIEIDVKEDEVSHITGYTADLIKVTGKDSAGIEKAGVQTLNGTQATAYCRIRATEGGDETRSERMKTVMMKTFEKLTTMDIGEVNDLIDKVFPEVETNFKLSETLDYAKDIASYKVDEMKGFPFTVKSEKAKDKEEAEKMIPTDFQGDVKKLHEEFFPDLTYTVSDNVKEADEILSK